MTNKAQTHETQEGSFSIEHWLMVALNPEARIEFREAGESSFSHNYMVNLHDRELPVSFVGRCRSFVKLTALLFRLHFLGWRA